MRPGRSNEAFQAASRLRPNLAAAEASPTASRTAAPDSRSRCWRSACDVWSIGGPLGGFVRAKARDVPRESQVGLRGAQRNQLPGPESRRDVLPGVAAQLARSKPTCRRSPRKAEQLGAGVRRDLLARRLGRGSLEWSELGRPVGAASKASTRLKRGSRTTLITYYNTMATEGSARARRTALHSAVLLWSIKEYVTSTTRTPAHTVAPFLK